MIRRTFDVTTAFAASIARVGAGFAVGELDTRPQQPLVVYEFENCPYCRKVREALSILDLDAYIYPCPQNGPRFRHELADRGGKEMFPYLIDQNTGKEMYESDDIVRYLFERYGDGNVPLTLGAGILTDLSSMLASGFRVGAGTFYQPARQPAEPLELYGFEVSGYCRLVREKLCTLEIPYLLHNVAAGSAKREGFIARSGKMQVPYLIDPNTGVEIFESDEIITYLDDTYAMSGDVS